MADEPKLYTLEPIVVKGTRKKKPVKNYELPKTSLNNFRELVNSFRTTPARTNLFTTSIIPPTAFGFVDPTLRHVLQYYAVAVNAPSKNIMSGAVRREHAHYEVPYGISYEPLSVSFYIDVEHTVRDFFKDWYDIIYNSDQNGFEFKDNYTTTIMVHALDKRLNEVYRYEMIGAYPKSISGLHYDSHSQADLAMMTVEFQYERLYEYVTDHIQNAAIDRLFDVPSTTVNSLELTQDRVNEVSIIPKPPIFDGIGIPTFRTEPVAEDLAQTVFTSPENFKEELLDVTNETLGKFTPRSIFGKE